MNWKLEYLPEAEKDLKDLNGSQRILVLKAIKKVQQNPLPVEEQGYGKPLGNHSSTNLAGLLKIKLRSAGLRVVYQLRRTESSMMIIVIGVRADEEVYEIDPPQLPRLSYHRCPHKCRRLSPGNPYHKMYNHNRLLYPG